MGSSLPGPWACVSILCIPCPRLAVIMLVVPEGWMIIGIDHVQITVPVNAVEEARAFYCGILWLQEIDKPVGLKD